MFVTPDGMFFQAINEIFLLSHDTFTVIPAKSRFGRAQQANGRIYVGTPEDGLNILEGSHAETTARHGADRRGGLPGGAAVRRPSAARRHQA